MRILAKNKQAYYDYEISDTLEAGIVLAWYEVKAIKEGKHNLTDAIVRYREETLSLVNMDIPLYSKASPRQVWAYDPRHPRTLLLHKRELSRRVTKINKNGMVIIPLEIIELRNRRIKIKLGLAKRMRKVQKKTILKEKDISRSMDRQIKEARY
jgi:SsrA-binding protein